MLFFDELSTAFDGFCLYNAFTLKNPSYDIPAGYTSL